MNVLTWGHMAVFAVVVILLFGAKKLPDAARSLGKSMRIFKSEIREMQSENKAEPSALETNAVTHTAAPTATPTPCGRLWTPTPPPWCSSRSKAKAA